MKFGNIQKFPVVLKLWLKIESFDHSGPAKDEIWQNPEILSRVQNLAQNEIFDHSEPAKSWNFQLCWKVGSKPTFLTTQNMRRMILAKCRHFESSWKFRHFESSWKLGSKLTFLTTKDLRRIKFGKILQFSVVLKIWLSRTDIFDLSEHAKDEIWQNSEIFSRGENLDQNWEFDHSGPAKNEIWLNPEILSCLDFFAQNWHSWPANQQKMKFDKIQKIWFMLKIWLKNDIFHHLKDLRRMKFGKILGHHVENLAKTDIFDNLDMGKMNFGNIQKFPVVLDIWPKIESFDHYGPASMKFDKIQKLWAVLKIFSKIRFSTPPHLRRIKFGKIKKNLRGVGKFGSKWDFWPCRTCKDEVWQNPEITNLAQKSDFWPLWTCGWNLAKSRISSPVENLTQNWHFWPLRTWEGLNLWPLRTSEG